MERSERQVELPTTLGLLVKPMGHYEKVHFRRIKHLDIPYMDLYIDEGRCLGTHVLHSLELGNGLIKYISETTNMFIVERVANPEQAQPYAYDFEDLEEEDIEYLKNKYNLKEED